MRKILIIMLSMLLGFTSKATNYYIGSGGNNLNAGTSIGTRWANVQKANTFTFAFGDSLLFAGGETHVGGLVPNASTNGLIIASYGTGKAILSGFTTLTSWVSVGTNLWEAPTPSGVTIKATCNILTVGGYPQAVGRSPNVGSYLVYSSATTTTLNSSALVAPYDNMVGAEVVFKNSGFTAVKGRVTAESGASLTYATTQPIDNNSVTVPGTISTANYGFFFQRFAASLDQQWEWFFNSSTNKMRIFSTVDPNTLVIKASILDTVINLGSHVNMTINNIAIEGGGLYGVFSSLGGALTVKNCTFTNNTRGVHAWGCDGLVVTDNTLRHSFNVSIFTRGSSNRKSKNVTISRNVIDSTGELLGNGLFWSNYNLKGVAVNLSDTANIINVNLISNNTITHTGYTALEFQGSNVTIRKNIIDTYLGNLQDGGAIYTFTNNASLNTINYTNRLVDSNFCTNAVNGAWGVGADLSPDLAGIYMDDQAANVTCKHNTVANVDGPAFQMNTPHDNIMDDNVIYNCRELMNLNKRHVAEVYNNVIKKNVMYQKLNTQWNFRHVDEDTTQPTIHTIVNGIRNIAYIDSNWISDTKALGFRYYKPSGPNDFNLATWKSTYLHEIASVPPPIAITNTNTNIYSNPSDVSQTFFFPGFQKVDHRGTSFINSVTVPAWSSKILIDNGAAPSTSFPTARAGIDQTITLPTSSVTVSGSASTDADGTIVSYAWLKISGTGGTITTPSSVSTSFTGLTAGVYSLELTVTDNDGATGKDTVKITVLPAVNILPTANAGVDQSITLPTSSVTLSGSGLDADGTITTYAWVKISGTGGTITSPSSASTTVTGLTAGFYSFQLTVTDNSGGQASDLMQVTVNPAANTPPTANAGLDKNITLPTSTTTLVGSGSDPGGSIVSYAWIKVSGPSGGTVVSPSSSTTNITALQQGTYTFQLTVTDNGGLTGSDLVNVVVNAANVAPTANAGVDQTITLPTSSSVLSGSGTDVDGTIASYAWTKISGPSGGNISTPSAASSGITSLQQGTYTLQLQVTDNQGATGIDLIQIVVNAANVAPTANAGIDQSITLPTNTATLSGSGTDVDGTITTYAWIKISGPTGGTITSPSSASTGVTALQQGTYQYQLTVTDNSGATGMDNMQIVVNPAIPPVNNPPTANAGVDQTITLPTSTATLTGSGTDTDGTIAAYLWTKISGPAGGTITTPTSASTGLTALGQGVYTYKLRVTDNSGDTAVDAVQIVVNAANIAPTSNAGADQYLVLPTSATTLVGSGTDVDGTITGYLWYKLSGPAGGTIASSTSASTGISALQAGIYIYQLRVTDNSGDTAVDAVQITVDAANIIPTANAGIDQVITLPTTTTTLVGTGTDVDGTITFYQWIKVSGPLGGTITSPTSSTTGVTSLQQGIYLYRLRVTDNRGDTASDVMQVTVNSAPNIKPVSNAGSDQIITLPTSSVTVNGSGSTDADGTITGYLWTKVSGPNVGIITTPTGVSTTITSLSSGVYVYKLRVTDNAGDTAVDLVQITVNSATNIAPIANAGPNQSITLPKDSVTLSGGGTDSDGFITTYAWTKVSGQSGSTIVSPNTASTKVRGLKNGTYVFQLTVTDNRGATDTDLITVYVYKRWFLRNTSF